MQSDTQNPCDPENTGGKITLQNGADSKKIQIKRGTCIFRNLRFISDGDPGCAPNNPNCSYGQHWKGICIDFINTSGLTIDKLEVTGCYAKNLGTFIARTDGLVPTTSKVKEVLIQKNKIINTFDGDAIVWNCISGLDTNVKIINNVIDTIVNKVPLSNAWGATGISLAGMLLPATVNTPIDIPHSMSGVTVAGNTISHVPSGIHIEYARDVSVVNNTIEDVDWLHYAPVLVGGNQQSLGIIGWAVENLDISGNTIRNVKNDSIDPWASGIRIAAGSIWDGSAYQAVGTSQRTRIFNNKLENASIRVDTVTATGSTKGALVGVIGNTLNPGIVDVEGRGDFYISGNTIVQDTAKYPSPRVPVLVKRFNSFGYNNTSTLPMLISCMWNSIHDSSGAAIAPVINDNGNRVQTGGQFGSGDRDVVVNNNYTGAGLQDVVVGKPQSGVGGGYQWFNATRTGANLSSPAVVGYYPFGSAVEGLDYSLNSNPISIPANAGTSYIVVSKLQNSDRFLEIHLAPQNVQRNTLGSWFEPDGDLFGTMKFLP